MSARALRFRRALLTVAACRADGTVKIWSTAALLDEALERQAALTCPLFTSASTMHELGVHVVRWSTGGRFLASGGEEGSVSIVVQRPGAPPPAGPGTPSQTEMWVPVFVLRGHSMPVQDVAWCPGDDDAVLAPPGAGAGRRAAAATRASRRPPLIATCSTDTLVCIWALLEDRPPAGGSAGQATAIPLTRPLITLSGHKSWVQGLSWDPLGHLLATFGDDRTVQVWRTCIPAGGEAQAALSLELFGVEAAAVDGGGAGRKRRRGAAGSSDEDSDSDSEDEGAVSAAAALRSEAAIGWRELDDMNVAYEPCTSGGPIRRLDFSADGAVLATSHAKVGSRFTAPLHGRPERNHIMHLCGHVAPVLATRSTVLLVSRAEAGGEGSAVTFPALLTCAKDRSIALWAPTRETPLVVLANGLFTGPVCDCAAQPVPDAASLASLRSSCLRLQLEAAPAGDDGRLGAALQAVSSLDMAAVYGAAGPKSSAPNGGVLLLAVSLDGSLACALMPPERAGGTAGVGFAAAGADAALAHMAAVYGLPLASVLAAEGLPASIEGGAAGMAKAVAARRAARAAARGEGEEEEEEEEDADSSDLAPTVSPAEVLAWLTRRTLTYGCLTPALTSRLSRPLKPRVFVPDVPLVVLRAAHRAAARAFASLQSAQLGHRAAAPLPQAAPLPLSQPPPPPRPTGGLRKIVPTLLTAASGLAQFDLAEWEAGAGAGAGGAPPPAPAISTALQFNTTPGAAAPPTAAASAVDMGFAGAGAGAGHGSALAELFAEEGVAEPVPPATWALEARLAGQEEPAPLPLLSPRPVYGSTRAVTWGMRRLVRSQREQRLVLVEAEAASEAARARRDGATRRGGQEEEEEEEEEGRRRRGSAMLAPLAALLAPQAGGLPLFAGVPAAQGDGSVLLLPAPPALPRLSLRIVEEAAAVGGGGGRRLTGSATASLMGCVDPAQAAEDALLREGEGVQEMPREVWATATPCATGCTVELLRGCDVLWHVALSSSPTVMLHVPAFPDAGGALLLVGGSDGTLHVLRLEDGVSACKALLLPSGRAPVRDLMYAQGVLGHGGVACTVLALLACNGALLAWAMHPAPPAPASRAGVERPPHVQLSVWTKTDVAAILREATAATAAASATVAIGAVALDGAGTLRVSVGVTAEGQGPGESANRVRSVFLWDRLAGAWTK